MKIAIIGPYPKPFGGISVHLRNFNIYYHQYCLKKIFIIIYNTSNIRNQIDIYQNIRSIPSLPRFLNFIFSHIYNGYNSKLLFPKIRSNISFILQNLWFIKTLIKENIDLIHYQGSADWKWRCLIVIIAKILHCKSILSVHGPGVGDNIFKIESLKKLTLKQKLITFFIKKFDYIICDNTYQIRNLKSLKYNMERTSIIKEFIPPVIKEQDYENIPAFIQDFYQRNELNLFGMGSNLYLNDINLWGLDMMISLIVQITVKYPKNKIGLIIKFQDSSKESIKQFSDPLWKYKPIDDLLKNIDKNVLKNVLIFNEEIKEIYPLIDKADIFLRPAFSEGDSFSVQEALFFNTPVIASDSVIRPKGCILFKNRDQNDFNNKVFSLIDNLLKRCENKKHLINPHENNAERIMNIYFKLIKQ